MKLETLLSSVSGLRQDMRQEAHAIRDSINVRADLTDSKVEDMDK